MQNSDEKNQKTNNSNQKTEKKLNVNNPEFAKTPDNSSNNKLSNRKRNNKKSQDIFANNNSAFLINANTTSPSHLGLNEENIIINSNKLPNRTKISLSFEEKVIINKPEENFRENKLTPMEKEEENIVIKLILNLRDYNRREEALKELTYKREKCSYLATYLWFSFGTVTIL